MSAVERGVAPSGGTIGADHSTVGARQKSSCRDNGFGFETILLDVDGTLIDSNASHAEAWTQALREHGVATDVGQIRPLIGMLPRSSGIGGHAR